MILPLKKLSDRIRIHSLRMVSSGGASHIASALSISDIVAVLYGSIMKYNPSNPKWKNRDRFILSKGHACVAIYAALAEQKFFDIFDLKGYGQNHSLLMNHISHKVPGVEFSTGSLGHGLPFGVGKALYAKVNKFSWRVFIILSDGELDEGSNWEALMFAAHHNLNNMVAIIDYNKLQSLGTVTSTLELEPLREKFLSFGAKVIEVDGHNHLHLESALQEIDTKRPTIVIAHTIKGKGVSFMENRVLWHYKTPSPAEVALAIAEIEASNA